MSTDPTVPPGQPRKITPAEITDKLLNDPKVRERAHELLVEVDEGFRTGKWPWAKILVTIIMGAALLFGGATSGVLLFPPTQEAKKVDDTTKPPPVAPAVKDPSPTKVKDPTPFPATAPSVTFTKPTIKIESNTVIEVIPIVDGDDLQWQVPDTLKDLVLGLSPATQAKLGYERLFFATKGKGTYLVKAQAIKIVDGKSKFGPWATLTILVDGGGDGPPPPPEPVDLTEVYKRLDAIVLQLKGTDTKVSSLDAQLKTTDSKVSGLDTQLRGTDSKVSGLDSQLKSLTDRVKVLEIKPPPPPPVDPFTKAVTEAYVVDGKQAANAAKLAAVYRIAAGVLRNPGANPSHPLTKAKNNDEVLTAMQNAANAIGVFALEQTRHTIAKELDKQIGKTSLVPLDAASRGLIAFQFDRVQAALEEAMK